jgi:hypothetical protein
MYRNQVYQKFEQFKKIDKQKFLKLVQDQKQAGGR